jgi:hypothetical protein
MGSVVAVGEQLLVGGRCDAHSGLRELQAPEGAVVRVVPDRDVVDLGVVVEEVGDVGAVLRAGLVGGRSVLGEPVHGGDDAEAPRVEHEPVELLLVRGGHLGLARLPLQRDADGLQAEAAGDSCGL